MSLTADQLLDRRRLKRRLFLWRILAVLAVAVALLGRFGGATVPGGRHVGRLEVRGIITEDRKQIEAINGAADDANVAALIVTVDSPGGSVAGGEALHDAIARVAAKKPVVTVMEGTAASAGYMISVPAARIFARNATLTGSIGVILETGEISGLLDKIGVHADALTSGPLKDQPSFTKPLSPEGRDYLHALVMDMYDQFVGMVADGRHIAPERVRALADGRAYTGHQALALGLIDEIGGEREARAWLARERHIEEALPISNIAPQPGTFRRMLTEGMAPTLKTVLLQGLTLDGLWAVWQPSLGTE